MICQPSVAAFDDDYEVFVGRGIVIDVDSG